MQSMVEMILSMAEAKGAVKVLSVSLRVGELTFLNPEQLRFAFEVLTEGTIAQGASLLIESVKPAVRCRRCGYEGEVDYRGEEVHLPLVVPLSVKCPKCGGDVELIAGRECTLTSIKVKLDE